MTTDIARADADIARRPAVDTLSFEQAQAELEQIVEQLEDPHTGLEHALALWERGEALHAHCQSRLDHAAERIQRLTVSAEDVAKAVPEAGGSDFAPPASVAPANGDGAPQAPADTGGAGLF
jgi:exodeoxyribonuclease VII small subunit